MQTISFYAYKGGSGRTLAVANIAQYLASFGQTVVALDFDLEAPGLNYKLYLDENGEPKRVSRGIVDYIYDFACEGNPPGPVRDYAVRVTVGPHTSKSKIYLIPAGDAPSAAYWKKLSRINWHELFYSPTGNGIQLFLELKERIRDEFNPDFLLIDSRTGITEIGGVATSILPETVVCLLLFNAENLNGARAVLRSLKCSSLPHRTEPIDIVPVLTRIPATIDHEREQELINKAMGFLNMESEQLEETLAISQIFVLHSEPELQIAEELRVGGTFSPQKSVLLRDYLHLFAHLVPKQVIQPHVSLLIERVKKLAFEDPDAAQKELEALSMSLGNADAYRELIKFYRLRNVDGKSIFNTAQELWNLTQDSEDPLLWSVVKNQFTEIGPHVGVPDSASRLRLVEGVWRAAGSNDVKIGCDLAESHDNFGQHDHAAKVLEELVANAPDDERAISQYLHQLVRIDHFDEADELIGQHRNGPIERSQSFVRRWAQYALKGHVGKHLETLTEPPLLDIVGKTDPVLAYRLLADSGQLEKAKSYMQQSLDRAIPHGSSSRLAEVGALFMETGQFNEFEKTIKERFPEEEAKDFLRLVQRGSRRKRRLNPDPW